MTFRVGDRVRVTGGALKDLEGEVYSLYTGSTFGRYCGVILDFVPGVSYIYESLLVVLQGNPCMEVKPGCSQASPVPVEEKKEVDWFNIMREFST